MLRLSVYGEQTVYGKFVPFCTTLSYVILLILNPSRRYKNLVTDQKAKLLFLNKVLMFCIEIIYSDIEPTNCDSNKDFS